MRYLIYIFCNFFRTTLKRVNLFIQPNDDLEAFKAQKRETFDEGKKISDFIGMITRLAFAETFVFFVLKKLEFATEFWDKTFYRVAAISAFIVLLYFALIVNKIIFLFCHQISTYKFGGLKRSGFVNFMTYPIFLFIGVALMKSIWAVISALAQAAKLS